jgi:hypothetical protein
MATVATMAPGMYVAMNPDTELQQAVIYDDKEVHPLIVGDITYGLSKTVGGGEPLIMPVGMMIVDEAKVNG